MDPIAHPEILFKVFGTIVLVSAIALPAIGALISREPRKTIVRLLPASIAMLVMAALARTDVQAWIGITIPPAAAGLALPALFLIILVEKRLARRRSTARETE